MEKKVAFVGKRQAVMESYELGAPGKGQVKVRTLASLMSTGTENIVFNRDFDEGTGWANWVKYPFYPGYTSCGVIEAVGEGVESFKTGDRVVMRKGHASAHLLPVEGNGWERPFLVPEGVAPEEAAWFGLAKIGAMGIRVAQPRLGKSIAVVGAGPIGQMALRWCAAAGAFPIVSIDTVPLRIDLALKGGATHGIAKPLGSAIDELKAICGGDAPDTIIDSTGHWQVFADVQKASKKYGEIVLLGDTGSPDKQHLTHDVLGKGLRIFAGHDCHETPDWNTECITKLFFHLVKSGRFPLAGLNTHVFKPDDFNEAYKIANERRGETMGIWFDWR